MDEQRNFWSSWRLSRKPTQLRQSILPIVKITDCQTPTVSNLLWALYISPILRIIGRFLLTARALWTLHHVRHGKPISNYKNNQFRRFGRFLVGMGFWSPTLDLRPRQSFSFDYFQLQNFSLWGTSEEVSRSRNCVSWFCGLRFKGDLVIEFDSHKLHETVWYLTSVFLSLRGLPYTVLPLNMTLQSHHRTARWSSLPNSIRWSKVMYLKIAYPPRLPTKIQNIENQDQSNLDKFGMFQTFGVLGFQASLLCGCTVYGFMASSPISNVIQVL